MAATPSRVVVRYSTTSQMFVVMGWKASIALLGPSSQATNAPFALPGSSQLAWHLSIGR